jgi:hypothetical protein
VCRWTIAWRPRTSCWGAPSRRWPAIGGASRPWLCALQKGLWAAVSALSSAAAAVARAVLEFAAVHPVLCAAVVSVAVGYTFYRRRTAATAARIALQERLEAHVRRSLKLGPGQQPVLGQVPLDLLYEEARDEVGIHRLALDQPFETAWSGVVESLRHDKRLALRTIVDVNGRQRLTVEVQIVFSPPAEPLSSSGGSGVGRASSPLPYPVRLQARRRGSAPPPDR